MAKQFASMSCDPRLHVGAVIVTTDGILYPGYNGWEMGGTNEPDSLEPGQSGCFVGSARVETLSGRVKIEQIKIGDLVLTHTGKYKKVTKTFRRNYNGKLYIL